MRAYCFAANAEMIVLCPPVSKIKSSAGEFLIFAFEHDHLSH